MQQDYQTNPVKVSAKSTVGFADVRAKVNPTPYVQTISCVYSGNRHFGRLLIIGLGPRSRIIVSYQGSELEAEPCALPAIAVGEALLRRLVVHEAIAIKVRASEPRERSHELSRAS